MNAKNTVVSVVLDVESHVSFVADVNGRVRATSGTIKSLDKAKKTLTLELDGTTANTTYPLDKIKSLELPDSYLSTAYALTRFTSYIKDGHQYYTIHESPIPQGGGPHSVTAGSYEVSGSNISQDIGDEDDDDDYDDDQEDGSGYDFAKGMYRLYFSATHFTTSRRGTPALILNLIIP